jgi:glutamate racemase
VKTTKLTSAAHSRRENQAPIGVFDSGVGGLSVWREIIRQLPEERTLYLADQAHVPYGPRSLAEIRDLSVAITKFLLTRGAKMIVVACNTASGAALQHLRATYPSVPFVGMEPAVKPATERTQSGVIGVLATPTTFEGELFRRLVQRFGADVEIYTQVCPGLVEAIEAGQGTAPETLAQVERCLAPLLNAGIDQLVLGCTHYPLIQSSIEAIVGAAVTVIDPAPAVARQVARRLRHHGLLNIASQEVASREVASREVVSREIVASTPSAKHTFYTSGTPSALTQLVCTLVGYHNRARSVKWQGQELRIA